MLFIKCKGVQRRMGSSKYISDITELPVKESADMRAAKQIQKVINILFDNQFF
jgi:hypothetical protein